MRSLANISPILGCWLLAKVAIGLPEYSDNAPSLSSSFVDACEVTATKTVHVTLSSGTHKATSSASSGAIAETTTILVSPLRSYAKTDATVDTVSTHKPKSSDKTSDLSSVMNSETSHPEITYKSTRTVTFTAEGLSSATSSDLSGAKKTASVLSEISTSSIPACITHTIVGSDGRTTIVESIYITSSPSETRAEGASRVLGTALPQSSAQAVTSGFPMPSSESIITSGLPVHTTVTILGTDGVASVVDTTWIIPVPSTSAIMSVAPISTSMASSDRLVSELSVTASSESLGHPSVTYLSGTPTCITVTVVGPDMKPTVSELTIIAPTGPSVTAASISLVPPSFVTSPSLTDLATQPGTFTSNRAVSTITWKVIGVDGTVSQITQTVTAPSDSIVAGVPASVHPVSTANIPPPPTVSKSRNVPALSTYSGKIASTTSTASLVSGIGSASSFVTIPSLTDKPEATVSEPPAYSLESSPPKTSYESSSGLSTIGHSLVPYDVSSSGNDWASSILYGSLPTFSPPATPVVIMPVPETPQPGLPFPTPFPAPVPTPLPAPIPTTPFPAGLETITTLLTSTWTNVIPEQTTTYVMKFPLTTLATITIPRGPVLKKRILKRQNSVVTLFPWSNTSITATPQFSSISSEVLTPIATPSSLPVATPITPANTLTNAPSQPSATVCATGGKVGNTTVNFDNLPPGPLLNPTGDLWFSEGFLIAPPASPPSNSFMASSGNQLVEFMPPALVPGVPFDGTGDKAEIGVGPNEISSCFRFNFYGANLGCVAEGVEKWCEFEISAYAYNDTLNSESSLSWSETKRVPACPNFPQGPCPLTPVQLDGYNNVTSILITVRVGLELRAWWGDDFQIGWADNSCEASACRSKTVSRRVKREAFARASRRGVWQWTANGAKKIDDDYVWSTFE